MKLSEKMASFFMQKFIKKYKIDVFDKIRRATCTKLYC